MGWSHRRDGCRAFAGHRSRSQLAVRARNDCPNWLAWNRDRPQYVGNRLLAEKPAGRPEILGDSIPVHLRQTRTFVLLQHLNDHTPNQEVHTSLRNHSYFVLVTLVFKGPLHIVLGSASERAIGSHPAIPFCSEIFVLVCRCNRREANGGSCYKQDCSRFHNRVGLDGPVLSGRNRKFYLSLEERFLKPKSRGSAKEAT